MSFPEQRVRDMMVRTRANLWFIEANARTSHPAGPFEVTQLINSMLGALAHPWEDLRGELLLIPLARAATLGWPTIEKEQNSDRDLETIGDLIECLRNGIIHGSIDYTERGGKIELVRAVSYFPQKNRRGQRKREWGARMTVADLRRLLLCFVELSESIYEDREPRRLTLVA